MDLSELQSLRIQELSELAKTLNIDDDISGLNKQELTLKILEALSSFSLNSRLVIKIFFIFGLIFN